MAGNAINAKSEALELRDLSSEKFDAVSGGLIFLPLVFSVSGRQPTEEPAGQNDPAQMFAQIMQQMTGGQ